MVHAAREHAAASKTCFIIKICLECVVRLQLLLLWIALCGKSSSWGRRCIFGGVHDRGILWLHSMI